MEDWTRSSSNRRATIKFSFEAALIDIEARKAEGRLEYDGQSDSFNADMEPASLTPSDLEMIDKWKDVIQTRTGEATVNVNVAFRHC